MEILPIIGWFSLALASAIVIVVVRALSRSQRERRSAAHTDIGPHQGMRTVERTAEDAERRRVQEEEAQHEADEARRRREEDARVAAEQEAQRQAEKAHRHAGEVARVAAEQEAQHRADESRRRREESARVAAEQEAQRQAEEAHRHAEEEARVAAEREAQHQADEALRRREEDARVAAEREAQRQAEEAHRHAEEEARVAAEREAQHQAGEARRRREEDARVAAEREAQRQAEEAHRHAEEEARVAAERAARRQPDEAGHGQEEGCGATSQEDKSGRIEAQDGRREEKGRVVAAASGALLETRDAPLGNPDGAALSTGTAPSSATLGEPATSLRAPRQYRPTARVPEGPRAPAAATADREARDRALPIEVRLVFEKAGFCRVSLLPRRAAGMPDELVVTGSGDPPELLVLQDEWYQDVALPNLERLLREGIEWAGSLPDGRRVRSSLSGRELYVLARHSELNGFVSAPRLILGEDHVVLCVPERLSEVRAAIALTGSPEPTLLNSDSGVPIDWVGLRGVAPRTPIAPSPAGDILDALRPLAEVEIALEGGIRIDRQTWLSGFAPSVRLRGDTSSIGVVTIDGHDATVSAVGTYAVPGWDAPGEHSVWCTSDSRTYAIRDGAENWESWDAYTWSLGELGVGDTQSRPAICGVLVRAPQVARSDGRAIVVPASNPVLIGASPGEIEVCTPRNDVRAGLCVGFPWFEPVWAIPANALHCDKRTARVLLIGSPVAAAGEEQERARPGARRALFQRGRSRRAYAWCEAILTAGRKGLQPEPSRTEIADLWKAYKRSARALRRSRR
jgi:hypothetical protein